MNNIIDPPMICAECLEKRECIPAPTGMADKECAECGEVGMVSFPVCKKTGEYLDVKFLIRGD
jgi:hypothetical protein